MQVLEKILEEIYDRVHFYDNADEPMMYVETVKDIISKHMSGNDINAHTNDGWIPVDRGLPEEGQEVWVSAKTECVRRGTYTKSFGDRRLEGFICSDGFMWMNTANAWKPYVVPAPYRPERSDNHDGE